MANIEKYTDDAIMMLLKHANRQLKNDANKEIITAKSDLNYAIKLDYNGLTSKAFYKQILDGSYLYGRGSKRESKAVTSCSWVITLPKSVSDYSAVENDEIKILNPTEENAFFDGVTRFVADRYGTVFYNQVHYDEGGQPHVHIYFVPVTQLDHDQIHYKTRKTHQTIKTDSGRYEFIYQFKLDNGKKIPLNNYARMSDYYDTKISAADVLNKAELQHFHRDLAAYLKNNNLPGADSVYTGNTDGKNISVKTLKKITKVTGLTIEELKEHPLQKEALAELLATADIKPAERKTIELINSEALINNLEKKLTVMEQTLETKQKELNKANARVKDMEREKSMDREWGSSAWGEKTESAWGSKQTTHVKDWELSK